MRATETKGGFADAHVSLVPAFVSFRNSNRSLFAPGAFLLFFLGNPYARNSSS
jgi:hypothetical protein